VTTTAPGNPTIERLEDQISWYERTSGSNKRWYKWLKGVTMVAGVLVPVVAAVEWGRPVAAGLGVVIVLAEGMQQLNQYQTNWISYRSTSESLKHEKYLFLAGGGPYAAAAKPLALLAERIEGMVSQENAKWVSAQEQVGKKAADAGAE
jgi:hypothetical protein